MNLFKPSATDRPRPSVPARIASNWIELLAIPIASALMEAQPIFLLLQLVFRRLMLSVNYLDVGSIVLLLLLFHWWGIWGYYRRERRGQQLDYQVGTQVTRFDMLGIILGLLLLCLTRYYALGDTLTVIFIIVLTGWAWWRGVDRARAGFSEDQLILFFKIGLGVILVVLTFSLLGDIGSTYSINNELLRDLPIFFLSGFVALSFTRIGAARREQARQSQIGVKEGTNRWVIALSVTWLVLIVLCVLLEVLPNEVLVMLLSPFWTLIGWLAQLLLFVITWIVYGFFFVINWLLSGLNHLLGTAIMPPAPPTQKPDLNHIVHPAQHQPAASPTAMLVLRLVIIAVTIAVLIAIVLFVKSRQQHKQEDTLLEEEELREGLDMQQVRRERRQERQRQTATTQLEQLEPDSVRIRYRGFLQSMAEKGGEFGRYPTETPMEYQRRLLLLASHRLPAGSTDTPSDPAILDEFTRAYAQERYGQQKTSGEQQSFLRQWLPHLLHRLATHLHATPRPIQKKPYQASRWGED